MALLMLKMTPTIYIYCVYIWNGILMYCFYAVCCPAVHTDELDELMHLINT